MTRPADLISPLAAGVVVLAVALGGAFFPAPRILIGIVLTVLWLAASELSWGRVDHTEIWMGALIAWGFISAVMVGASPLASKEALAIWMVGYGLWAVTRRGSEVGRRLCLGVLVVGASGVAFAVMIEAVMESSIRVGGLLENPNITAALLVPTLPLGWALLEHSRRWRWSWAILMVVGIVLTGSRAGLLAAVLVIGWLMPRGRVRFTGIAAGSSVALAVLAWRFVTQPDVLAWHRVSIWWATLKIWATRPLTGVGPGCLAEAAGPERILHPEEVGRYQFVVGYAESTPLAVLVQLGIVGVLLAGCAVLAWWSAARHDDVLKDPYLPAALTAAVVLGAFHDFLTIDPVLWWWAVLFACTTGPPRVADEGRRVIEAPAGARLTAALVVIWLTAWGIITPALARWTWLSASPTSDHVVKVLRIEPWLSAAPASRVRSLLNIAEPWSWEIAAEALGWARTNVDVHPGLARRWADLGRVHLRILADLGGTKHDENAARESLTRACELDPHLPWTWLERARLEWLTGDLTEAVRLTHHALAQEPNAVRGWLLLCRLELDSGRIRAARSALDNAEKRMGLAEQPGLSDYDLDLLEAPRVRLESLRDELGQQAAGGS